MARALLLLLLLLGIAVEALAQNATTNSSTGVADVVLSSTGVDDAWRVDRNAWRRSTDWLMHEDWGRVTFATFLVIILLCALVSAYCYYQTTRSTKPVAAAKTEAQAVTKSKVRNGFSTVPSSVEEEEEGENEEPSDFSSMKYYRDMQRDSHKIEIKGSSSN